MPYKLKPWDTLAGCSFCAVTNDEVIQELYDALLNLGHDAVELDSLVDLTGYSPDDPDYFEITGEVIDDLIFVLQDFVKYYRSVRVFKVSSEVHLKKIG